MSNSMKCLDCALKHLAASIGWGKVTLTTSATVYKTRMQGELLNAQHHLASLGMFPLWERADRVRARILTHTVSGEDLDELRRIWISLSLDTVDKNPVSSVTPTVYVPRRLKEASAHLNAAIGYYLEMLSGHALAGDPDHRPDFLGELMCAETNLLDGNYAPLCTVVKNIRRGWQADKMPVTIGFKHTLENVAKDIYQCALDNNEKDGVSRFAAKYAVAIAKGLPPEEVPGGPLVSVSEGAPVKDTSITRLSVAPVAPPPPTFTPMDIPVVSRESLGAPLPVVMLPSPGEDQALTKGLLEAYLFDVDDIHSFDDLAGLLDTTETVVVCPPAAGLLRAVSTHALVSYCAPAASGVGVTWDTFGPQRCSSTVLKRVLAGPPDSLLTRYHTAAETRHLPEASTPNCVRITGKICCSMGRKFRTATYVWWNGQGYSHLVSAIKARPELHSLFEV